MTNLTPSAAPVPEPAPDHPRMVRGLLNVAHALDHLFLLIFAAAVSTIATSLDLLFVTVFSLGQFASLTLSLFVSLTLTPMMCSKLLRHNPSPNRFDRMMEALLVGIKRYFAKNPPLARNRQL